jgi:AbrB family looped-hinge helix DNA binding protein
MRDTIDKAGRLVIPRALRNRVGLAGGGELEIEIDGAAIDGPRPLARAFPSWTDRSRYAPLEAALAARRRGRILTARRTRSPLSATRCQTACRSPS